MARLRRDLPRGLRFVALAWLAGELAFLGLVVLYLVLIARVGFRASFSFLTPLVDAWPPLLWIVGLPVAALTFLAFLGAVASWLGWLPVVTTFVGSRGRLAFMRGARRDFRDSNAGGIGLPVYHLALMGLFMAYVVGNLDYGYDLRWARFLYVVLALPLGAIGILLARPSRAWLHAHAEEPLALRRP